ncbi:hypothetical protein [uncultured Umboniibacter sp.]|uniref:hypothetical protein n=1 Tax=uncultured Umboniibacter sp. TaxID=1798917 RepID=UPI00261F192E|nr:hypothetical protein [uncultured Umboniibacter sp.]
MTTPINLARKQLSACAKALKNHLTARHELTLSHAQSLNAMAISLGWANFDHFKAKSEDPDAERLSPDAGLSLLVKTEALSVYCTDMSQAYGYAELNTVKPNSGMIIWTTQPVWESFYRDLHSLSDEVEALNFDLSEVILGWAYEVRHTLMGDRCQYRFGLNDKEQTLQGMPILNVQSPHITKTMEGLVKDFPHRVSPDIFGLIADIERRLRVQSYGRYHADFVGSGHASTA